jgi:hypothetical protein
MSASKWVEYTQTPTLQFDFNKQEINLLMDDDTGVITLKAHAIVCPRCHGKGKHDHPAFANGISEDQFANDPDFYEEYMSGILDVLCEVCQGRNVVLEANQKNDILQRYIDDITDMYAEQEAEMRYCYGPEY